MDRLMSTGIPLAESLCLINRGRGGRRQVVAAVHGSTKLATKLARTYRQWRNMKPSHKCCNNTNNNVINTLSKLKLHVESIPVQHLGSIWVWKVVQRLSNISLAVNTLKIENAL